MEGWAGLPSVVLQSVYKYLTPKDRLNASSTCINWRRSVFQSPLGDTLNLTAERSFGKDWEKYDFLSSCFAHKVPHLSLTVDAGSPDCLGLACATLNLLERSTVLKSLCIRYTENCIANSTFNCTNALAQIMQTDFTGQIIEPLLRVLVSKNDLESVNIPLVQDLVHQQLPVLEKMVHSRMKYKLTDLFLTTISSGDVFKLSSKGDNRNLNILPDPSVRTNLLLQFTRLQKLSIDHDLVTDTALSLLGTGNPSGLTELSLTAVRKNISVSNNGWQIFVRNNPRCKVRLTVIGSKVILDHQSNLCFPTTPLSHFRALYCHQIRMNMLNSIIMWNENRLEHLELINENQDWMDNIIQSANHQGNDFIDPIIFAAWRVKTLRTIKIGYLYGGHDLIGVAKLAKCLDRFEIPYSQILFGNIPTLSDEISRAIGRPWVPINDERPFSRRSRTQVMQRRVCQSYLATISKNY